MTTSDHSNTTTPAGGGSADPATVSLSGYVIDRVYEPDQVPTTAPGDASQPHERIGEPGQFPYTRGV
ncbi:MAG: hypothetical protein HOO04_00155, partial [Phycisphaerae bacterium]|nr:hypothetical protein [Phycisphaerae bacterium]